MKGILLGILIGVFAGFIATFIFFNLRPCENVSNDFAIIRIKNASNKEIKKLLFKDNNRIIETCGLNKNEEIRFIIPSAGENVYNIIATFINDSSLTSKEIYFEYGYRGIETIKDSEIISTNNW